MQRVFLNSLQSIRSCVPFPVRASCEIVFKVAAAVFEFFRIIAGKLFQAWLWLKNRVVNFLNPIANPVDPRRVIQPSIVLSRMVQSKINIPSDRAEVLRNASLLINSDSYTENDVIINSLIHCPVNQRDNITSFALQLIDPRMGNSPKMWTLKAVLHQLANISFERRANVVECVRQLMFPRRIGEDFWESAYIIQAVAHLPDAKRADIVQTVRPNLQRFRYRGPSVFTAIANIPVQEMVDVVEQVIQFIGSVQDRDKIHSHSDVGQIISAIAAIPAQERADVVQHVTQFIDSVQNRNEIYPDATQIISTVAAIPTHERSNVIQNASQICIHEPWRVLCGPDSVQFENRRALLIRVIAAIPQVERANVIELAQQIIRDDPTINNEIRREIIETIAALPASERSAIVQSILESIDLQRFVNKNREKVFKAIVSISTQDRADVIRYAMMIIDFGEYRDKIGKEPCGMGNQYYSIEAEIIESIAAISAQERADVMGDVQQIINIETDPYKKVKIIQDLATLSAGGRTLYIEQWMAGITKKTLFPSWDINQVD